MKHVKRIGWILLGLLVLIFLSVFIVLRFYEDEIGEFAMKKLKTQITTQLEVEDVGLVFWKTFPNASVALSNIYVQESGKEADTLLYANALYLKFNLWDIFHGSYRVDEVEVSGGNLHLSVNDLGENNWEVWKETNEATSNFEIELDEIALTDTRVVYRNEPSDFLLDMLAMQVTGSGVFSKQKMDIDLDLDALVEQITSKGDTYLEKRLLSGEIAMSADLESGNFVFARSEVSCGDLALNVEGSISNFGAGALEIYAEVSEQRMEEALAVLPPNVRKSFSDYLATGEFSAKGKISRVKEKDPVMVEVELSVNDGTLKLKEEGVALEDIATNFYYVRGAKKDQIRLKSFACSLEGSELNASGSIVGFEKPQLNLNVSAQMQLKDIRDFFDIEKIEMCEGSVTAEAALNGTLLYVKEDSTYNWKDILATGNASIMGASLKMKNSNRLFSDMKADFAFDKQNAVINEFSGVVNGSDFSLKGTLSNVISYLFEPHARVFLDGELKSASIDFTNLVEEETSTETNTDYELLFPPQLDFKLNCSIGKFVFRKFEALDVKGLALLDEGKLLVDPVSFNSAGGRLNAQLVLAPISSTAYRMNVLADLNDIQIDRVFTEFENFGQTFIQDHHLKGVAHANVQFRAVLTNALELPSDKIESIIHLTIDNGELNGLETLQEIAEYIRGNKWMAPFVDEDRFAEKMKNVKFSKLENTIEIKDRVVTIPLMDVRSSAMDIWAKGSQTFDYEIDYAIKFNLRDLLVRKEKEWEEDDDGLGKAMYISMKGTTNNPVYAVDRELAKEMRKEELEAEKQNMKALLKDEFGLFKKDESVGTYKEKNTGGDATITIEWEEEDASKSTSGEEKKPAPKPVAKPVETEKATDKKKKTPKWLEEKE